MKNKYIILIILILIIILISNYNYIFFNFNVIYEKNIYSTEVFNNILSICNNIKDNNMVIDYKATNRLMYQFDNNNKNTQLLQSFIFNNNFIQKVRNLTNNYKLVPCLKIPIEYRKYTKGSYMKWHSDAKILSDQLQYECVITLTNTSNSFTLFDKILYIDKIYTEPNSLIVVRANGISHMVTETTTGERTILKFVFYEIK